MLKLLDAKDLLEHLIELVLAEDELGHGAEVRALGVAPRLFLAAVDGVELGDPGAEHGLLAQAVDLGQAAHPFLNVLLEDLAEVVGGAAAPLNHPGHTLTLQEALG